MIIKCLDNKTVSNSVNSLYIRGMKIRTVTMDKKDISDLASMPHDKLMGILKLMELSLVNTELKELTVPINDSEQRNLDKGLPAKCSKRNVEVDEYGRIVDPRYP